ncbi:hypothetical protein evm_000186 [Chilo suppressalis]|nr:hypothetical protein evm_000186 [Chilo suppressalis]
MLVLHRAPSCFGRLVKTLVPTASAVVSTDQSAWPRAPVTRPSATPETKTRDCALTPKRAYAAAAAGRTVAVAQPERNSTHPKKKGSQDIPCATPTETRNRNCDEEGFITVERKKRKPTRRNLCGVAPIGPNNLLRPAIPVTLLLSMHILANKMKWFTFLCVLFVSFGLIYSESSRCLQPVDPGPCKVYTPRFAYSRDGGCQRFIYGGCKGNDNNFETYEECERACVVPR